MSAVLAPTLASQALPAAVIPVAAGDGIGPEIMAATLDILLAADPSLRFRPVTLGLEAYRDGHAGGVDPAAWDAIREHGVLLKGPLSTPQGGGYKSVNVTLRKTLGLYANVRPCVSYHPWVRSLQPGLDVVIVRENEEDTYAGIEHRQTDEVYQCLKIITRPGCERVIRHAFEYARAHGRRKVTCMTKDNIMKLTDGLFHKVFDEIAPQYPEIAANHLIVDIGTARLASRPRDFDVIVTPNLYGDILSDLAAELAGSVGLAGSANIGHGCAVFEAVHGSAPDIAGRGIANPSGVLLSAVMLLAHIGRPQVASRIHNAWLRTLEDGIRTADIAGPTSLSYGTAEFAKAVVERLGLEPRQLPAARTVAMMQASARTAHAPAAAARQSAAVRARKDLVGVDVFLHWGEEMRAPAALGRALERLTGEALRLEVITNRGVRVYPNGHPETYCTDHWRCRFVAADGTLAPAQVPDLMRRVQEGGFDVIKTENLYTFNGERGYSGAQGA
jgi:isocitrate dehydrogenase